LESPPFFFDCHRCGLCCRAGHGRVWLREEEVPALARERGLEVEAFVRRFLVRIGARLSVREEADGRCALLEGEACCTVYPARPGQCRSFPFWPSLLAGGPALEEAAEGCPGIQRLPEGDPEPGLRALARLLGGAPGGSAPCPLARGAGRLEASALEADLACAAGEGLASAAGESGDCPFRRGVGCRLGAFRPLACRGLDPEALDPLRRRLQDLAGEQGWPLRGGPWPRLFRDRRRAWAARGGAPPAPGPVG